MKLCNLVDIVENNIECVVLKVKDNKKIDLIKLGYFNGNEDIIRLTKGKDHVCCIFYKDGTNKSWEWGDSGYTLVSEKSKKAGKLIEECITEDFDIYIGSNKEAIKKTLYINSLDDVKDANHFIEYMYWDDADTGISVHKDGTFYKLFENVKDANHHFKKLGYKIEHNNRYVASTGCIVEEYFIEKSNELDKQNDIEI